MTASVGNVTQAGGASAACLGPRYERNSAHTPGGLSQVDEHPDPGSWEFTLMMMMMERPPEKISPCVCGRLEVLNLVSGGSSLY